MSLALKPYTRYKDSGAPWFGAIPAHWTASRLGAVLVERGETNARGHVQQVLSVLRDIGVIPYEEKGNIGNKKSEDIRRYKVVRPGDIVVNCMNVIIGSVGLSRYTGCLSPVYYVLKPRNIEDDSAYFNNVFRLKPFQRSLIRIGNGILAHRMRIPMELLKCEVLPRPPREEQAYIVRFLSHFDQRINRLIHAKRRLVKLLDEQKQVIIHRAVTRGLDPDVRLKASGVDWLGDVPEHWEVRKLKHLLAQPLKYGANEPGALVDRNAPRYIRITDIGRDGNLLDKTFRSLPEEVAEPFLVNPGDILLARSGATVGKAYLHSDAHGRAAYAGYLIRARLDPRLISPSYLYAFLQSRGYWTWISSITIQATIQNVSAEKYANLSLPLPFRAEQSEILQAMSAATVGLDLASERARREIDLLHEYRTRLIADVVTGKLDVRGVELEEIEALDGDDVAEDEDDLTAADEDDDLVAEG